MESSPVILAVGTECPPEAEEEFQKWYEKHVSDLLQFRGVRRAARLKLLGEGEGKYPQYLAVYEFENRQAAEAYDDTPTHYAAIEEWNNTLGKRGAKITRRAHYQLMKTWQK